MLTATELSVIQQLADCASSFSALPRQHPSDLADFVFHIHALQNIVMSRATARAHPDVFSLLQGREEA